MTFLVVSERLRALGACTEALDWVWGKESAGYTPAMMWRMAPLRWKAWLLATVQPKLWERICHHAALPHPKLPEAADIDVRRTVKEGKGWALQKSMATYCPDPPALPQSPWEARP